MLLKSGALLSPRRIHALLAYDARVGLSDRTLLVSIYMMNHIMYNHIMVSHIMVSHIDSRNAGYVIIAVFPSASGGVR